MKINKRCAIAIKKLRKLLDLSQHDLAKILSSTQATVSHWEAGKYTPSLEHFLKFIMFAKKNKIEISLDKMLLE